MVQEANHFLKLICLNRTNQTISTTPTAPSEPTIKVTTTPSTSFRGHLLYQLKTNLSSISMLTPPVHPSNNPPSLLYANPNQLINPTGQEILVKMG